MDAVSVLDRVIDCTDLIIGALSILVPDTGQAIPKQHSVAESQSAKIAVARHIFVIIAF